MTIKEIRVITGLSQVEFGKKYDIPRRTIQNWEARKDNPDYHECPIYVRKMLERIVKEDYNYNEQTKRP